MQRHAYLLLSTLFAALAALIPPAFGSWVNDCDNSLKGHCVHGPTQSYMVTPHISFNLESGVILGQGAGPIGNTVFLLSENPTGNIQYSCKDGKGPSKFLFEMTPNYSYVEAAGPRGDKAKAHFVGSDVLVSYQPYDKPADVSHKPGLDLLLYCPFVR